MTIGGDDNDNDAIAQAPSLGHEDGNDDDYDDDDGGEDPIEFHPLPPRQLT